MTLLVLSEETAPGKPLVKLRDIMGDDARVLLMEAYALFLLPDYIEKYREQVKADAFKNAWSAYFALLKVEPEESSILLADFIKGLDKTLSVIRHRASVDITLQEDLSIGKVKAEHVLSLIEYGAPGVPAALVRRNLANHYMSRSNESWKEFKDKHDKEISEFEVDALTGNI